jgi:hypothetical protein
MNRKNIFLSLFRNVSPFVLILLSLSLCAQKQTNEVDIMGVPPGIALIGDGKISASFSREGKMVCLFYPRAGAYDCIPYYTGSNPDEPLYGAPEHLGIITGLAEFNGSDEIHVKWANEPVNNINHQWEIPAFTFCDTINNSEISYEVFSSVDQNSIVYDIRVRNLSKINRTLGFCFYGLLDPKFRNQNPVLNLLGQQSLGWNIPDGPTDSKLSFDSSLGILTWEKDYCVSLGSDLPVFSLVYARTKETNIWSNDKRDWGEYKSIYKVSETYTSPNISEKLLEHINGIMIWNLGELKSQESKSFNLFLVAGDSEIQVKGTFKDLLINKKLIRENSVNWWKQNIIQRINNNIPEIINKMKSRPNDLRNLYWWAMTMRLMADRNSGGISASPVLIPKYYGCWPRDASFQVIAWISLGFYDMHKIISIFCSAFQTLKMKTDGTSVMTSIKVTLLDYVLI